MSNKCPICSTELINISDIDSNIKILFCDSCSLLKAHKNVVYETPLDSKYKSIQTSDIAKYNHINNFSEDSLLLEVEMLTVEEAWKLISEHHEISKGRKPEVIIIKNALSTVMNPYEMMEAISIVLAENGIVILEDITSENFLNLNANDLKAIDKPTNYFSTRSIEHLSRDHDLDVIDVEKNGSNKRWYLQRKNLFGVSPVVVQVLGEEDSLGLNSSETISTYLKTLQS